MSGMNVMLGDPSTRRRRDHHRALLERHREVTRRHFLALGAAGVAALGASPLWAQDVLPQELLAQAIAQLEYLTPESEFMGGGRGNPPPHELSEEQRRAVGLDRDTWQLEVVADPASDVQIENPLSKELGTAIDWAGLMALAERHAVRYMKAMTCLNVDRVFGMGLWEGVPLRDVIWMTRPVANLRRVWYHGYHHDPERHSPGFQSSLSINRVLEDPPGEQPVILAYKMNGQWLAPKRGGPVRLIMPDGYGFKSIKWLQRIVLTNDPAPNDTYAGQNNDVDTTMKTFARFLSAPNTLAAGAVAALTGVAQVGMSGLSRVQYCVRPATDSTTASDPYLTNAPWQDADILPPPSQWGGDLPEGQLPQSVRDFDAAGRPLTWPMRYTIAHWAALLTAPAAGTYELCCRTIDSHGVAQPLPRPLPKSGRNEIQRVPLTVT
ncbi:MAG: molybdopterin-dependent oxidoreductase [Pirellulaceae bacterium]|nr:molybdopterin-dependent oxidoreductase [Pirellulaceae bacterium]